MRTYPEYSGQILRTREYYLLAIRRLAFISRLASHLYINKKRQDWREPCLGIEKLLRKD